MPHDVFISHSQKDRHTANAVCHALESRGMRCWMAPRDIEPGKDWMPAIAESLAESRALVLVFSSRANGSRHVAREVSIAFNEEVPIIPFRIEEVPPSTALKYAIGTTHWLDAMTPPLDQHLDILATKVRSLLASQNPQVDSEARGAAVTKGSPAMRAARGRWTRFSPQGWAGIGGGAIVAALLVLALRTGWGGDVEQPELSGPTEGVQGMQLDAGAAVDGGIPAPPNVEAPPAAAERSASGLAWIVLKPGDGETVPTLRDRVRLHITAWLPDGTMWDSTVLRGQSQEASVEHLIPGMVEALQLMSEGEQRRLWIPSELAYEEWEFAVFDVYLLEVLRSGG